MNACMIASCSAPSNKMEKLFEERLWGEEVESCSRSAYVGWVKQAKRERLPSRVVLPLPDGPMRAVRVPGTSYPDTALSKVIRSFLFAELRTV